MSSPFSLDSMNLPGSSSAMMNGMLGQFTFNPANLTQLMTDGGLPDGSPTSSHNNSCGRWGSMDRRTSSCATYASPAEMERKYGKAMWCPSGACAANYWQPCEEHRCTCCKFGRKVIAYEKQGHCGPCGKREVVTGLRFIRCGKCKAEMVEKAYEAHLKQYVVVMDHSVGRKVPIRCKDFVHTLPKTELPCTQGKRCSKCSNMRPLSYFINEESTCNWHAMQKPQRAGSLMLEMCGLSNSLDVPLAGLTRMATAPPSTTARQDKNKDKDTAAPAPKKRKGAARASKTKASSLTAALKVEADAVAVKD